jgi:DNA-binding winged helix-turn-helix (wHTH) protein/pimeloyl-ACP methyl ester carboxylesterase
MSFPSHLRAAALDANTVRAGARSRLCDSLPEASGFPCLLLPEPQWGARPLSYVFEDYSLDPGRRELRRGAELVPVEPLVFDLLEFLIGNRERVVSKDDLIASVWNGRIVSESTLTSRMNAARQAVGDSGEQQRLIRTIPRKGFRFVGEVQLIEASRPETRHIATAHESREASAAVVSPIEGQTVTFCQTKGGINLATASIGQGPILIRAAHWATNIEYDRESPITGPLLQRLAERFRLVRYDGRGAGLSDRNVGDVSFATMLEDLETVVDSLKLSRFPLLGISGGAATSIAYAVRHPERVSRLVLLGGYAQGRNMRGSPQYVDEARAFQTMLRSGWGDEHSAFMRAFCSFFIPGASAEEIKSFVDFQRMATTGENAMKMRAAVDDINIVELLHQVSVPTNVFHAVHDNLVPFDQGRRLAASIPNAKFVPLESANHALLSNESAWVKFVSQAEEFLAARD